MRPFTAAFQSRERDVNKLRVLDLFSGIGGFSLGLERTGGFETVAFCEIDPFARSILKKHWPHVPCHNDVQTMEFPNADAIAAGFPCQDISSAGKRAGITGERSGLWREVVRAVCVVRPVRVLLENVAALLVRGMGTVLGDLAEVGYDAEWDCIPASGIGAWHGRDRIWITAYPERNEQPRKEPRLWSIGRVGRVVEPFPWDGTWQDSLAALRRESDGLSRSVDRTDCLRNAVVPQIPELIGRAILESLEDEVA